MPSLQSVFDEVKANGPDGIKPWYEELAKCDAFQVSAGNSLVFLAAEDPMAMFCHPQNMLSMLCSIGAFMFEVGRTYGRSELMEEIGFPK